MEHALDLDNHFIMQCSTSLSPKIGNSHGGEPLLGTSFIMLTCPTLHTAISCEQTWSLYRSGGPLRQHNSSAPQQQTIQNQAGHLQTCTWSTHTLERWRRGGMVFTFLAARGLSVGASLVEADKLEVARQLEEQARARGVQLLLPTDVVVADSFSPNAVSRVVPIDAIPDGWMVRPCVDVSHWYLYLPAGRKLQKQESEMHDCLKSPLTALCA